jgi:hypothetical protein
MATPNSRRQRVDRGICLKPVYALQMDTLGIQTYNQPTFSRNVVTVNFGHENPTEPAHYRLHVQQYLWPLWHDVPTTGDHISR